MECARSLYVVHASGKARYFSGISGHKAVCGSKKINGRCNGDGAGWMMRMTIWERKRGRNL